MATIRLPLEITQGSEFRQRFTVFFDPGDEAPAPIGDFSAALTVRRRQWQDAPLITQATSLDSRITNGGDEGWFEIFIPANATQQLPEGEFYYWFTVWPTGDNTTTECWLRGPFKILPGIEVG